MHVLPPVSWAHLALAAVLAAEPPDAREADAGILYYLPADWPSNVCSGLPDAVGIYTRDLGLAVHMIVHVVHDADPAESPADIAASAARFLRTPHARLAFWCVPSADGHSVTLISVEVTGTRREDRMAYDDRLRSDFYRAVALKLRAILTSSAPDAAVSAATPAPAAVAKAPAPIEARPPVATAAAVAPAPADESARWALALQYGLGRVSGDFAGTRQSVGLELAAGPASVDALEIYAGARLARAAHDTVPAGTVELSDVPLWLGARWVGRGRDVALGLGAFATAHLLSANARSPAGASSDTFTASGGGGLEALLRVPAAGRWSLQLTAWADAVLPRTHLLLGDKALDTGVFQAGVSLGAALSTR